MIAGVLLFLQTATTNPANLVVRHAETIRVVPITYTLSGAYIRADLLAVALGGSSSTAPAGRYQLTLGQSRIEVTEGIPFARIGVEVAPMLLAPLRSGQNFLVPLQLATSVIPRFATGFNYDVASAEVRVFAALPSRVVAAPQPAPQVAAPVPSGPTTLSGTPTPPRSRRSGRRLVVVDAGHGGPDNGMTGPIGGGPRLVEKHVTLSVARYLEQELRNAGVDVLMTRHSDTLIALSDRGRIANRNKGDVFVSVHVNATGSRRASAARERGYETYFLAEAKTEEASRVERMENEAVKFETGANAPKGDPLSFIINDMAQNEHLRESNDLAETIQGGLRLFHPGKDRGVQQANFAVLRGSYMPAVLVEIGFGTNPSEAAYLNDHNNQREIAASIARSVLRYLDQYDARIGTGTF